MCLGEVREGRREMRGKGAREERNGRLVGLEEQEGQKGAEMGRGEEEGEEKQEGRRNKRAVGVG